MGLTMVEAPGLIPAQLKKNKRKEGEENGEKVNFLLLLLFPKLVPGLQLSW